MILSVKKLLWFILIVHDCSFAGQVCGKTCSCEPLSNGDYPSPMRHDVSEGLAQKWGQELGKTPLNVGEPVLAKFLNTWLCGAVCKRYSEENSYDISCFGGGDLYHIRSELIKRFIPLFSRLYQALPATHDFLSLVSQASKTLPKPPYHSGAVQVVIIPPGSKIVTSGDSHGDYISWVTNVHAMYHKCLMNDGCDLTPNSYFVCTGDYADRSFDGLNILAFLLSMKCKNPNLFMLRGNHETEGLASVYGLRHELLRKYGESGTGLIWPRLMGLFRRLPQALLIGSRYPGKNRYRFGLWCHAGLEERLTQFLQGFIHQAISINMKSSKEPTRLTQYFEILGDNGLMWSDSFAKISQLYQLVPGKCYSTRGAEDVYDYDKNYIKDYLKQHFSQVNTKYSYTVDFINRGHGHIPGGVVELRDEVEDDQHWKKLESEKRYPIQPYSVFTHTSSELPLQKCAQDAFSVVEVDNKGQYFITPHIQEIPEWQP